MAKKNDAADVAGTAAKMSWEILKKTTLAGQLYEAFSPDELDDLADDELEREERRHELEMEMMKAQARAAQEWAIAERIGTATEVEIEEFYEGEGEGEVGVRGDAKTETITVGAHGAGRKVTRRIVRLKGWRSNSGDDSDTRQLSDD